MEPLARSDIIPKQRRTEFVESVFGNVDALIAINDSLLQVLLFRQQEDHVIKQVSDLLADWVSQISPYIIYGGNQAFAKHILDAELRSNVALKLFCEVSFSRKYYGFLINSRMRGDQSVGDYRFSRFWEGLQQGWVGTLSCSGRSCQKLRLSKDRITQICQQLLIL